MSVWAIILGIVMICVLATVHEIGHFLGARMSGIPVEEFSIGFGPPIFKKEINHTLYKLCMLPILGYTKIKGMEGDFDAPDGYFKKGVWQKFITIFLGPFMNFVLAMVIFSILFTTFGNPFVPTTTISTVITDSPAYYAGLKSGDKIIEIDGVKIDDWTDSINAIRNSNGKTLQIVVEREGKEVGIYVQPKKDQATGVYQIGITASSEKYSPFRAIYEGAKWTGSMLYQMLKSIPMLFTREGLNSMMGPIGIVGLTGEAAAGGVASVVWLAGLISIALGFTNLLPIPALDGGWLILIIWEAITRKPIPPEKQASVQGAGFIFLLGLMVFISWRDILRLLGR